MKNLNTFYKSLVLLAVLMSAVNLFGQPGLAEKKIIVIDPGHGGIDSGAIGINGIKEKEVVLEIVLEVVRLNESLGNKSDEIYLTRYSDKLISLNNRTKLAKALKADIFISLHCNQSDNQNAKGTEVYASNSNGKYIRQSIMMGYEIEKALVSKIGLKSRGVRFANFQVLRETVDVCPSVLVEVGFLSNVDEADFIAERKYLKVISLLLWKEIIKITNYE